MFFDGFTKGEPFHIDTLGPLKVNHDFQKFCDSQDLAKYNGKECLNNLLFGRLPVTHRKSVRLTIKGAT